ncbi:hypothetical protein [Acetobacter cerevisiae]|uniref:hypothetical protein n=1 Tax=Acetobacter cerevisiae TaxID=178900 RepID=UPI001E5D76A9|nr:hypothetical protein [Acetobacter cerevisiae]
MNGNARTISYASASCPNARCRLAGLGKPADIQLVSGIRFDGNTIKRESRDRTGKRRWCVGQ